MTNVVRVVVKPDDRIVELYAEGPLTVRDIVRRLGFSLESVVVMVNGRVVGEWERVRPGSEVLVLRAVSSG